MVCNIAILSTGAVRCSWRRRRRPWRPDRRCWQVHCSQIGELPVRWREMTLPFLPPCRLIMLQVPTWRSLWRSWWLFKILPVRSWGGPSWLLSCWTFLEQWLDIYSTLTKLLCYFICTLYTRRWSNIVVTFLVNISEADQCDWPTNVDCSFTKDKAREKKVQQKTFLYM